MPSDERIADALRVLEPQLDVFRFAVASALERANALLAADSGPAQAGTALGNFAAGRIDPSRFALVSAGAAPLDSRGRDAIEQCVTLLLEIASAANDDFVLTIPPGASAGAAVRERLAKFGRAFAAAAIIELVRRRTYDPALHPLPTGGHPFERWSTSERRFAPPLVVVLDGADIEPFEFGSLLDGCVHIVLLVNGASAAAPLARLISPAVFVAQTDDWEVAAQIRDVESPAIVAFMNGSEARFVHDPRRGAAVWLRLQVSRMPLAVPRKSIGARSGCQQRDDLAHLDSLSKQPLPLAQFVDDLSPQPAGGDPTERLTAWLLEQSQLSLVN